MMLLRITLAVFAASALTTPAISQASNPAVQPALEGHVSQLAPDALYEGWRWQQLIGQQALRRSGGEVGIEPLLGIRVGDRAEVALGDLLAPCLRQRA